ncbi:MAG: beta-ketoacyl synthase N-terminal-like domain-containing protein [Bacteroidota bacterium]|nr:beta-ketoacyl synthase N-terminal-like domain-containing protein [Bacteroidota bacterium]MDP4217661.1 beta-ketoacyl synthase N-terminal-like domain-containing protein [Bacteroidota bacterium]MDP4253353.1 beta-ketoacyl synthase N-terminal-like domain-containing protein [Bacteroidota bacterium]MDP4256797.1 beta-ketoacyl synthase N-terminal-like domain-containing protein [Bacteroidota bacterium]
MTRVFVVADNIISPLGISTTENFEQLKMSHSGVMLHEDAAISAEPFYASLFDQMPDPNAAYTSLTSFELLLLTSIQEAMLESGVDPGDSRSILIISSTKGNISLLETGGYDESLKDRIALHRSAKIVAGHFGFVNPPVIVSNACISGIVAILTGMRLIRSGRYKHAIIAGADVISKFVMSGFQAFQAVSASPCKPFDRDRSGINLGEAAATLVLSGDRGLTGKIEVAGGAVSNDANHLSAPSRTGEELAFAIGGALKDAGLSLEDIDFISAHGTATLYNDEMEAKAIALAGLRSVPVNSLKGYYGHTLGAAGLIESIISIRSMEESLILPTQGFANLGVTTPLNICVEMLQHPISACLKTASGFGGCNAALVFSKD